MFVFVVWSTPAIFFEVQTTEELFPLTQARAYCRHLGVWVTKQFCVCACAVGQAQFDITLCMKEWERNCKGSH